MKQLIRFLFMTMIALIALAFYSCYSANSLGSTFQQTTVNELMQSTPTITTSATAPTVTTTPAVTTSAEPPMMTTTEKPAVSTALPITEKIPDTEPTPAPPGSLPDPDSIPKADQSDVGKTITLSIGDKTFDYFYDSQSGKERLLVLESVDFYENLGKITVYETTLGGLDGLIAALKTPIEAKLLAVSNISWEEVYYSYTEIEYLEASTPGGRFSADELIDLSAPVKHNGTAKWYCSVQSWDSADVIGLLSNLAEEPSEVLQERMDRIDSIIYRFDLAKYL